MNGTEITLIVSLLNKIFKVPNHGHCVTLKKGKLNVNAYNTKEWMKVISSGQSTYSHIKHWMLNQDQKVLYYIIC